MRVCMLFLCFFSTCLFAKQVSINYYKCVNERGVTYSQQPCGSNGTQHTLTHSDPQVELPSERHYQTLNELEKKQIVRNLKRQLRAKKQQIALLMRDRDRASRDQQDRVNRIMDDKKRKETIRDIKKQLRAINKQYQTEAKAIDKQVAQLEKKLKRYQ